MHRLTDDDDFQMTPEILESLANLCARRNEIADEAFREGLCEMLQISRTLLDKAIAITESGFKEPYEAGLISFDDAYAIATTRN